jgi:hypothetical protein
MHKFTEVCSRNIANLRNTAEQGNAEAQCILGYSYRLGYCFNQDNKLSYDWFLKSANQNNAEALLEVGMFYNNGLIKDDQLDYTQLYKKAYNYFIASANQGNATAMFMVGHYLECALGVEKNLEKAFYWYQMAANHGDIHSYLNLGQCYEFGRGVSKNLNKAAECYNKAADFGDDMAKYFLERLGK